MFSVSIAISSILSQYLLMAPTYSQNYNTTAASPISPQYHNNNKPTIQVLKPHVQTLQYRYYKWATRILFTWSGKSMNFSDNGTVFIVPTALHLNRHATTTVDGQTGTCNFYYICMKMLMDQLSIINNLVVTFKSKTDKAGKPQPQVRTGNMKARQLLFFNIF